MDADQQHQHQQHHRPRRFVGPYDTVDSPGYMCPSFRLGCPCPRARPASAWLSSKEGQICVRARARASERAGERAAQAGIFAPLPALLSSLLHPQPIPHHPSSIIPTGGRAHEGRGYAWGTARMNSHWMWARPLPFHFPASSPYCVQYLPPARRHDTRYVSRYAFVHIPHTCVQ